MSEMLKPGLVIRDAINPVVIPPATWRVQKTNTASKIQRPGACDADLLLIENSGIGHTRIS
jgi:hypothetical protein